MELAYSGKSNKSVYQLCSDQSLMPRSHFHGSPRRFYYGLNLTDDPGNAVVRYGCTIYV